MSPRPHNAFVIGATIGLALALAPSCGSATGSCGPDNCATGCCSRGLCLAGTASNACGKLGAQCAVCSTNQTCSASACSAAGGGGGTMAACSAATCKDGCCFRGVCMAGQANDACGTGGIECLSCGTQDVCKAGSCRLAVPQTDAGETIDSGLGADAGVAFDSGVTSDGGALITDAGATLDAGASHDAGEPDAGATVDAGLVDAGTFTGDGGLCAPKVTISQVYNNNYKGSSTYKYQFVELHSRSAVDIDLSTWSLQVAPPNSKNWVVIHLSGTLPANGYVLIQGDKNEGLSNLPTPYIVGGSQLSLKTLGGMSIALVSNTTALSDKCPTGRPSVVDFMSYGSNSTCAEGPSPTTNYEPIFSDVTASYQRAAAGCTDTNVTSDDFSQGTASPRTAASPIAPCSCQ